MKVIPFTNRIRKQLTDIGYTAIEFAYLVDKGMSSSGKDTQIVRAFEQTEVQIKLSSFEAIGSERVSNLLADAKTKSFIFIRRNFRTSRPSTKTASG
jgi:hypothetical protein